MTRENLNRVLRQQTHLRKSLESDLPPNGPVPAMGDFLKTYSSSRSRYKTKQYLSNFVQTLWSSNFAQVDLGRDGQLRHCWSRLLPTMFKDTPTHISDQLKELRFTPWQQA